MIMLCLIGINLMRISINYVRQKTTARALKNNAEQKVQKRRPEI